MAITIQRMLSTYASRGRVFSAPKARTPAVASIVPIGFASSVEVTRRG